MSASTAGRRWGRGRAAARAALSLPTTLNLIAWGEGLGGTLAIAAAAKQPQHVVKCAAQNPRSQHSAMAVRNSPAAANTARQQPIAEQSAASP